MAFNSNGQVSYLVLDSLSQGSKYGLEIIEYISQKTGGSYLMKKPTLYSCLTRMEKKGLVSSSYWGESELGGKRHYYSITNSGRKTLSELAMEFENISLNSTNLVEKEISKTNELNTQENEQNKTPIFLQQDNIFNMFKEQPKPSTPPKTENETTKNIVDNQIDIFTFQEEQPPQNEEVLNIYEERNQISTSLNQEEQNIAKLEKPLELSEQKDDAKMLEEHEHLTYDQEIQNKRLYDTSSELKKYRKRKSFSENQIEMSVVYERAEEQEIQKARIEELKASMLSARQHRIDEEKLESKTEQTSNKTTMQPSPISVESNEEEAMDGIFITEPRIHDNEIPIQRKITPPNIEIDVSNDNLPAPKRDSNLEPTYKDMMAKLFEHKKEKTNTEEYVFIPEQSENYTDVDSFVDYASLKKYYSGHGIEFKEYKKSNVERKHNTNLLVFVSSTILLLLSGIGSAILFGILSGTNLLNPSMNFLFYTIPCVFAVFSIYTFIKFKVMPSRKAILIYNSYVNWAIFVLSLIVIVVVNILIGMQYETIKQFLTALLLPTYAILIAFPINYYIKKFVFKKFAK